MDKTGINPQMPYLVKADPLLLPLIPDYLKNRRKDVDTLLAALQAGDFAALRKLGHNMRGSGAAFGLPPVTGFGGRIEDAALAQDASALRGAIDDLRLFLDTVKLSP